MIGPEDGCQKMYDEGMESFDKIPLYDIDPELMTEVEKENVYEECMYDNDSFMFFGF